jgi:predicted ATPase
MDSTIKTFIIKGLFKEKDISINFNADVTILIADNGLGKTTILGIIYAVLSGQLHRLRNVEFELIRVEFQNGTTIDIPAQSIQAPLDLSESNPAMRRLLRHIPENLVYQLFDETKGLDLLGFRRHPLTTEISEIAGVPPQYVFQLLFESQKKEQLILGGALSPQDIRKQIKQHFTLATLYFPTYRRIEEDIEQLGFKQREGFRNEVLIQFGMADVEERIKKITEQIKASSVAWYSKINGQMLSQLVDGIKVDDSTRKSIQDKGALKIVLDRIGENITPDHIRHIIELVESGDIADDKYESLVYFLSNLIKIYDQQKDLDNAIKDFTRVCNKYLVQKEIVYNESDVTIGIFQTWNRKAITLANLSSGEKQIISLFSRLYLDTGRHLALLFDEPELSLSIEWQRMLIPDIVASGRCRFLLATTHSPFIFENQFDHNAYDLGQFITLRNS